MEKEIKIVFFLLIGAFLLSFAEIFVPGVIESLPKRELFFLAPGLFFLFGGILVFLTFKKKVQGRLRKFLLLTGFSAVGFLFSILLHNFFYALAQLAGSFVLLKTILEAAHVFFFLFGLIGCPGGFLAGSAGVARNAFKRK